MLLLLVQPVVLLRQRAVTELAEHGRRWVVHSGRLHRLIQQLPVVSWVSSVVCCEQRLLLLAVLRERQTHSLWQLVQRHAALELVRRCATCTQSSTVCGGGGS